MTIEKIDEKARELLSRLPDLSDVEIMANNLLLAVYTKPEKTAGGIILTEISRDEDKFQGKACLVIKSGPKAFVSDAGYDFSGQVANVGDWVMIRPSDGMPVQILSNGSNQDKDRIFCRIVADSQIRMKIPSPDLVY